MYTYVCGLCCACATQHFQRGKTLSKDEEQTLALAAKDFLELSTFTDIMARQLKRRPGLAELATMLGEDEG